MGIVSALVNNVIHGSNRGASTITQQYVKNVCIQEAELLSTQSAVDAAYADCTGGIQRKLKEARSAIALEKAYTKRQILLGYLNIAGFGGRIYGIEAAAQYYYGVKASQLSIAQAASLMAIVNNPNYLRLDVKANYAANKVRRDYVLDTELKYKFITQAQHDAAVATPIAPKITPTTTGCAGAGSAAFFCDYVVNVVRNDPSFGKTAADRYNTLQSAGWKIYTTLDLGLQAKASTAMKAYVPAKSPAARTSAARPSRSRSAPGRSPRWCRASASTRPRAPTRRAPATRRPRSTTAPTRPTAARSGSSRDRPQVVHPHRLAGGRVTGSTRS